jgi:hypothetical protein
MKARRVIASIVFCWAGAAGSVVAIADSSPLFVGVLEDVKPGNLSPAMSVAHVRVAFQKRGAEWVPLKTDFNTPEALAESHKYYPDAVSWTVVFDGKRIGTIESKNPGASGAYGDVGTQTITTDHALIPKISSRAADFSHFDNPAKTRPLVLVSAPHFKDPEGWKPTTLSEVEKKEAIKNFRNRFPSLEQCDKPEEKPIHMVPYSDKEILFIKAFRSRSGEIIFGQRLDDKRSNCGFFDDELFFDYWFVRDEHQQVRWLGSQMMPMDAVDLDDSGHSEWIFQTGRGEDQDGYELFYDNFAKKASFHWTYH